MPNDEFEIIFTKDGSSTVYSKKFNATYHSAHGALQESNHVFIKNGLLASGEKKETINILEYGLGTFLNAALTIKNQKGRTINYIGLEKYPLPYSVIQQLNYGELNPIIENLHHLDWNKEHILFKNFKLKKLQIDFNEYRNEGSFDLIYFDAFAPETQKELWTQQMIDNLYFNLRNDGILVTYCAKGEFKRNLKAGGFTVESLPGPPGKREMVRAVKSF